MFQKFASYLSNHPLQRHLLFLGLAIITTILNGYHYGTFDQVFHITFLKKFMDPSLYPNDPFLSLRWYHFSYFWFAFIPLFRAGILEISMFILHVLTVYGTIWMFWVLSDILFNNNTANLLISLALIFPHLGLPGFQIIEFSLLNRTFVLPFILGSILLYLKGKKHQAYLLLGLIFNLHAIYALFVLCMFLLNEALTFKFKTWWKPLTQFSLFVLASLPVLIWRMRTGSGIDLTLRPEMLDLASRGLLYSVYYPIGPISHVIGNFIAGFGTVWAFILGFQQTSKTGKHQTMLHFVIAIGVLIFVATLTSYLFPVTIILQLQLLRAGVFMLYFSMLYLSYFLCSEHVNNNYSGGQLTVLYISFLILITPLFTVLFWFLIRRKNRLQLNPIWLVSLVLLIQALTVYLSISSGLWSPGLHIYGPKSPWRDAQEWAKENTSIDALFISPPHIFGHYIPDWRVFSERATVATIPEMMEIPFDPKFSDSFVNRFSAIAPGAIEAFDGNYMRSIEIAQQAFYTNSTNDFTNIACQFSADYLVVERNHSYDFDLVFQNQGFSIYLLPSCN